MVIQPSDLTATASFHATLSTFPSNLVVNSLQQVPWHFQRMECSWKNSKGTATTLHLFTSTFHTFLSKLKTIPQRSPRSRWSLRPLIFAQSPWRRRCPPNTKNLCRNQGTFFKLIKSSVVLSSFSCICCKVLDTSSIQES